MNKYYENYLNKVKEKRLNKERIERSFGEQMKPVKIAGELGKILIHVLSFGSAVILPAYGFELLFGSFAVGLAIGVICFLTFVEIPKWATINTIFENYYDNDMKSYGFGLFAFCLIAISIVSSTFGVPIAVNRLSPDAKTISLVEIEEKKQNEVNKSLNFWQPQIDKHNNDAKDYFTRYRKRDSKTGEWRLSSDKKIKVPYNDMLKAAKVAQSKLNNRLDSIDSKYDAIVLSATKENKRITDNHNFKKDNAGFIAMWIMLFLELSYILIVWGLKYYDDRTDKEIIETDSSNRTTSNNTREETDNTTNNGTATVRPVIAGFKTNKDSNSIGIVRTCINCSSDITHKRSDAKFCSTRCRGEHHKMNR